MGHCVNQGKEFTNYARTIDMVHRTSASLTYSEKTDCVSCFIKWTINLTRPYLELKKNSIPFAIMRLS